MCAQSLQVASAGAAAAVLASVMPKNLRTLDFRLVFFASADPRDSWQLPAMLCGMAGLGGVRPVAVVLSETWGRAEIVVLLRDWKVRWLVLGGGVEGSVWLLWGPKAP